MFLLFVDTASGELRVERIRRERTWRRKSDSSDARRIKGDEKGWMAMRWEGRKEGGRTRRMKREETNTFEHNTHYKRMWREVEECEREHSHKKKRDAKEEKNQQRKKAKEEKKGHRRRKIITNGRTKRKRGARIWVQLGTISPFLSLFFSPLPCCFIVLCWRGVGMIFMKSDRIVD